jgi:hypothetical protein
MIDKTLLLSENFYSERIIIFGEMHSNKEDKELSYKLIKEFKPDFLLHELLGEVEALTKEDIRKHLNNCHDRNSGPILCEPSLNKDIYEIGYKYNIPIIGIDFDDHKGTLKGLNMKRQFLIRERKMVEGIKKYYNKGKLFVVVGDTHLRTVRTGELGDISLIQKEFMNDNNVRIIRSENGEIK